jgi:hypothetical protein
VRKKITDKERLDYIEDNCAELVCDISNAAVETGEIWNCQPNEDWHRTARRAIDAAIRASHRPRRKR